MFFCSPYSLHQGAQPTGQIQLLELCDLTHRVQKFGSRRVVAINTAKCRGHVSQITWWDLAGTHGARAEAADPIQSAGPRHWANMHGAVA